MPARFSTPFAERMAHAERYRSDPGFRLRKVNRARTSRGVEPLATVDQIKSQSEVGSHAAYGRERVKGRFV